MDAQIIGQADAHLSVKLTRNRVPFLINEINILCMITSYVGLKNHYLIIHSSINYNIVDFVVTGCSSGQGMMLACNSMPGILCGYTPTP